MDGVHLMSSGHVLNTSVVLPSSVVFLPHVLNPALVRFALYVSRLDFTNRPWCHSHDSLITSPTVSGLSTLPTTTHTHTHTLLWSQNKACIHRHTHTTHTQTQTHRERARIAAKEQQTQMQNQETHLWNQNKRPSCQEVQH